MSRGRTTRRQMWADMAEGEPMINLQIHIDARIMASLIQHAAEIGALATDKWSDFGRQVIELVYQDFMKKGKLMRIQTATKAIEVLDHYGFSTAQISGGRAPRTVAVLRGEALKEDFDSMDYMRGMGSAGREPRTEEQEAKIKWAQNLIEERKRQIASGEFKPVELPPDWNKGLWPEDREKAPIAGALPVGDVDVVED